MAEPVYIDRDMWEKIILNLLSNAFKFTLAGGVTVQLRASAGHIELRVRDTGTGIPAEEVPRLFERFHRIEGAQARTHEGSSIGLALVQDLVHLHSGTITAASVEGQGTTFTVTLPLGYSHLPAEQISEVPALSTTALGTRPFLSEAERWLPNAQRNLVQVPQPTNPLRAPSMSVQGARVLVVDDNADMRDYLARLLAEQYTVRTVSNGAEALAAMEADLPDLVLADVMMPELDGFALLERLRSDPRTTALPVILLSARADAEAASAGLALGADDYLVKPFSAREVLSHVAARLEIAHAHQEAESRMHSALTTLLRMAEVLVTPLADDEHPAAGARTGDPQRVLALVQHVFKGQFTGATLANIAADTLEPLAVVGLTPEIEARWWAGLSQQTMSAYLPQATLDRLHTDEVIELDLSGQPPVPGQDYLGIQRILIAEQRLANGQLCLIGVEVRDRPTFTAQERDLARAAARLVALVVERARLLEERTAAQAQVLALQEATRRMNVFLSVASHELRTPLTSITANVQMSERSAAALATAALPAAQQRRVDKLHLMLQRSVHQLQRLDRLVGDLLDVVRLTADKLEMRPEPCDLVAIVQDAIEGQRAAWPERNIMCSLPKRHQVPIMVDPDRIGQVVVNFLTNALKYAPPVEPIAISVRVTGQQVRVRVRDVGPGLTAAQQAHLFERFYRVPGIEQQSGSDMGLGLGLYICKTIIERQGGTIGVESIAGQGATFWFTLPLASPAGAEERDPSLDHG